MTYKGILKISKDTLKYYNKLLQLDLDNSSPYYNENDIETLNAKTDDYIGIICVEFSNGNYITIDLASGDSNYYDNIVLWDKNGNELLVSDCTYEISSFSLFYDNDIYDVEIKEV